MNELYLFHLSHIVCLLTFGGATQVLIAGNEAAFRELSKDFVPQKMKSDLGNQEIKNKEQVTKVVGVTNNRDADAQEHNKESAETDDDTASVEQAVTLLNVETMQVNLDQLVQKVKEKVLRELQITTVSNDATETTTHREVTSDDTPVNIKKLEREGGSVNQPITFKKKPTDPEEVAENNEFYEKVILSKGNGKKDSYEDYVTPKKDDIFESEEKKLIARDNLSPKRQQDADSKGYTKKNITTRPDIYEDTQKHRPEPKKSIKTTPNIKTTEKARIQYIDDDYTTKVSVPTEFLGGETAYIDGDYEDVPIPTTKSTKRTPAGYVNTKSLSRKKKIVTNMAVKERYTIVTPNYYEKLNPGVAETFRPEEPLPENDRKDKKVKVVVNQPAAINGKFQV